MPNGEIRLRLNAEDGSGYIKTLQLSAGAWQNAHVHETLIETYVVQSGWMALVELIEDTTVVRLGLPGDVMSTRPGIAHNVYLAASAIIHTVKHGGVADWKAAPHLDAITSQLSEADVRARAHRGVAAVSDNQRYASYISIYNHLDSLIWVIPGVVSTAGLSAFGLLVEVASRLPRDTLGWLFLALGVFFFLGGYSVMRLRFHHTVMGQQLRGMEGDGYFGLRQRSLKSRYLPGAPHLFMLLFYVIAALVLIVSVALFADFEPLLSMFSFGPGLPR